MQPSMSWMLHELQQGVLASLFYPALCLEGSWGLLHRNRVQAFLQARVGELWVDKGQTRSGARVCLTCQEC